MNRFLTISAIVALLSVSFQALAQPNLPLSDRQVRSLSAACVHNVHPDTIAAIIRQESAYYPYSLSINYPQAEARSLGFAHAQYQLARQPKTKKEAILWTRWLLEHGHTVSIGLMQINTEQLRALGITDPIQLFDPCLNIAAGAIILQQSYRGQTATIGGLANAFALYNAGSISTGTRNGYASGVIQKAPPVIATQPSNSSLFRQPDRTTSILFPSVLGSP